MMPAFTLEQKLHTAHVKRWQIVRVAREQTLAEHHYLVYQIVGTLCDALDIVSSHQALAERWALIHDLPEVITGDIATPAKLAMREAVPHDDPVRRIELQLDDSYADLYLQLKNYQPHLLLLVKIADIMEAMRFLALEGRGSHAEAAMCRLYGSYLKFIRTGQAKWGTFKWDKIELICHDIIFPELSDWLRTRLNKVRIDFEQYVKSGLVPS